MTDDGRPGEAWVDTPAQRPLTPSGASSGGLGTRFVEAGADPGRSAPGSVGTLRGERPGITNGSAGGREDPSSVDTGRRTRRQARRSSRLLWGGLFASTLGLCVALFVVYVNQFSTLQQHREQRILLNEYTGAGRAGLFTGKDTSEGQPAGTLTIPAIGLDQVVVYGTSATDLLKGPGLMPGTARPGSLGNSVIAGHRTIAGSPFAHLDLLRIGDHVVVVSPRGRYVYRVVAVGRASPGHQDPTSPNRHPRLTLVTSDGAGGRLFVSAALKTPANQLRIPRVPPSSAERGLSGDPAAVAPSILWGLVLAGALGATLWAYRRYRGRHWTVYLLSTPILLAAAFVWYGNLIRLLPGTM